MFDVHLVQINSKPPSYPVPLELPTEVTSTGSRDCETPISVGDEVEIEYTGWLADGKVFDEGAGLKFVVGSKQLIAGIDQGVVGYCKGGPIQLTIPPKMGYGSRWEGPVPQWSYVYYEVTVTQHLVTKSDGEEGEVTCKKSRDVTPCGYVVGAGDYVQLSYTVTKPEGEVVGSGEMRYPVGRGLFVPGWDDALIGMCPGEERVCWIPANLAHKPGSSLFLIPPETGFYSKLTVVKVLLTADGRDSVDLLQEENIRREEL